jgi:hypothetical protein
MIEFRCIGCLRLVEGHPYKNYLSCAVYPSIEARWRMSDCPMAWHIKTATKVQGKVRVGQQRQAKRGKK